MGGTQTASWSKSGGGGGRPEVYIANVYTAYDDTCGLYYKCFTIIIYDHNDSGQYYKTTITIITDDPS